MVDIITLKEGLVLWNKKIQGKELSDTYCRRNKEKSFCICTQGCGYVDKYFDVGWIKINKRYYVDKLKLLKAIDEINIIMVSKKYIEGINTAYNDMYELAHHGRNDEFFWKN